MTELLIFSSTTDQYKRNKSSSKTSYKIPTTSTFQEISESDNGVSSDLQNTIVEQTSQTAASVATSSSDIQSLSMLTTPVAAAAAAATGSQPVTNMMRRSSTMNNFDPKRETDRIKTFKNWPCRFIEPRELAKYGFYYYQKRDYVRCAFCKIEISHWEENDNVLNEHRRWSFNCPFLCGLPVGNIPISSSSSSSTSSSRVTNNNINNNNNNSQDHHPSNLNNTVVGTVNNHHPSQDTCGIHGIEIRPNTVPEHSNSLENNFFDSKDMIPIIGPQYPNMCTVECRMKTYCDWPRSISQKPHELSEAGFFYTGQGDKVICFSCGGGLKNWGPSDDPWRNHAKWFSKCSYVLIVKGREFVYDICNSDKPVLNLTEASELSCNSSNNVGSTTTNTTTTTTSTSSSTLSSPINSNVISSGSNSINNNNNNKKCNNNQSGCSISISNLPQTQSSLAQSKVTNSAFKVPTTPSDNTTTESRKEIEDGRLCKICYSDELQVAFIPCRHIVACAKCAPSLTICAVCKQKFTAVVRVFLC